MSMTSLIYKQHNYKKSAHHKNNLLAHRGLTVSHIYFVDPGDPQEAVIASGSMRSAPDQLPKRQVTTVSERARTKSV